MIKDLGQDKSRELLRRGSVARLACVADNEPYVVPVNYVFDGESVLDSFTAGAQSNGYARQPARLLAG